MLDDGARDVVDAVVGSVLVWISGRVRAGMGGRRPKSITIYRPNNEPLRKVIVKSAEPGEEPEIEVTDLDAA